MTWWSKLLGFSVDGIVKEAGDIFDDLHMSGEEKQAAKLKMEQLVVARLSELEQTARTELATRENIMVAEMRQGDNYTKRARPTVVYAGLGMFGLNYCLVPAAQTFFGVAIEPFPVPTEFTVAWASVVGIYAIGRTAEKRGSRSKVTQAVTGSKLLDDS